MDSDHDDGIRLFGTAFEQLESNEVVSKKPDIDQTVRDEKGRRRFHGAFTGGFSAGYWNTVGSAEGFTPQMFKSSRKDRYGETTSVKPEDFMDEEDFSAYGIAPKKVHTTDDYVDNLQFAGMRGNNFDDAVRSIFASSHESIGKRLYRLMKSSSQLEKRIKYGHQLLMKDYEKKERIETVKYQDVDFKCKDNFHGIGYTGAIDANKFLFKPSELSGKDSLMNRQNTIQTTISGGKKLKISGEAFGVGALEEDDEYGGMSVYFNEDMSQYDFELGKREERPAPKKKRKFKDTRNLDPNQVELESFRKSKKTLNLFNDLRKHYRQPVLPKNWEFKRVSKPDVNHKTSRWDAKTSKPLVVPISTDQNSKNGQNASSAYVKPTSVMNANVRSLLIGEDVVYKTGVSKNPAVCQNEQSADPAKDTPTIHTFKPLTGLLASKFISSNASKESTSTPHDVQLTAGLSTFASVSSTNQAFIMKTKNDTIYIESDEKVDPPIRITFEWHPHRLLCKRFGLQDPFVGDTHIGIVGSYKTSLLIQEKLSVSQKVRETGTNLKPKKTFTNLFQNMNEVNDYYSQNDPPLGDEFDRFKAAEEIKIPEGKEVFEYSAPTVPKASLELLKSVFASDEEDMKSDDEGKESPEEYSSKNESRTNVSERKSNSGLFAGIDFNAVNAQQFNNTDSFVYQSDRTKSQRKNSDESDDDDGYGPAPPPSLDVTQSSTGGHSSKRTLESEGSKSSKRKKSRKEKKSKKSKKKSRKKEKKKKEKKRKHRESSSDPSSSSSSSNEDNSKDDANLDSQIMAFIKQVRERAS